MKFNTARLARIAKWTGWLSAGTGTAAILGANTMHNRAARDAADAVGSMKKTPYWKLRLTGRIPLHAKVLTTKDEIADHALEQLESTGQVTNANRSAVRRAILNDPMVAATVKGENAAYAGRTKFLRRPVYLGNPEGMGKDVASHETGHYRADKSRPWGEYSAITQKANTRPQSPKHILGIDENYDGKDLSIVGIENEAWDMAPGAYDPKLRNVAVDSYRAAQRAAAIRGVALPMVTTPASIAVMLKILKKFR